MKTMETGLPGLRSGFATNEKSGWMLPVALLIGAAAVIALLFFSLHQQTETKFLQMQYMVEDVQANADEKVRLAQQDVFLISQKYAAVQDDIKKMQQQLSKMETAPKNTQAKPNRTNNIKPGKTVKHKPRSNPEDLSQFGHTALTSNADDPTVGFKKGELL